MLNEAKSEAFSEKMIDLLNYGALSLEVSIGHRTRLFDTMSRLSPSPSEQIAVSAGLNERYVHAQNGAGLGTMWGKELACEMLEGAGFTHIEIKQLPHDFQNYFYIVRKQA